MIREPLTTAVIGCAIEVHRVLGPGLLESMYERCFARELALHQIAFMQQAPLPISYKGLDLGCGYRVDFVINDVLAIELKAVDRVLPIHHAQMLTYLKLLNIRQGILINFNVPRLVDGLKSVVL